MIMTNTPTRVFLYRIYVIHTIISLIKTSKKYTLIISNDNDQSTSDVLEWLLAKEKSVIRVSNNRPLVLNTVEINKSTLEIQFVINRQQLKISDIDSVWYRRGSLNYGVDNFDPQIAFYLQEELASVNLFFEKELDKKAKINRIQRREINKLSQLIVAHKCKLNIPKTILTTQKSIVFDFIEKHKKVVTKSIQSALIYNCKKVTYCLMTNVFNKKDLREDNFFMTKFQLEIEKQYELRIFYLSGEFYSMAIFSQKNKKTKVDFRNYDLDVPNRCVPYKTPDNIKFKLRKLMETLELNSGSIDMIVTPKDEYYFLEVNPVGQFGMVSYPCNYNLEKKLAEKLTCFHEN